jgi:hypothetical protein
MPQTAADYIALYETRKSPFSMTAPWRHPNPLIRALSAKQEMWLQAKILDGLDREISPARDVASDAYLSERETYRSIIQLAWDRRPKPRSRSNLAALDATLESMRTETVAA